MEYINNTLLAILLSSLFENNALFELKAEAFNDEIIGMEVITSLVFVIASISPNTSISDDEFYSDILGCNTLPRYTWELNANNVRPLLQQYHDAYTTGKMKEVGLKSNVSYKALKKEFMNTAIDKTLNLRNYVFTDKKYIPVLLCEYMNNPKFIKEIEIRPLPNNMEYSEPIYSYSDNPKTRHLANWEDFLLFRCVLDIEELIENKKPVKTIKHANYPPQQKKIYNYLEKSAKNGIFRVSKDDILRLKVCDENSLNQAIARLNKQFKEMNNTDEKLLSYDKEFDVYIIHDIWGVKPE